MKFQILATLGTLAITIGFANPVRPQSNIAPSETRNFTLSGETLAGLQSRTADNDYTEFFAAGDDLIVPSTELAEDDIVANSNSNSTLSGLEISEDVSVVVRKAQRQAIDPIFLPQNEVVDGVNQVQVQLEL